MIAIYLLKQHGHNTIKEKDNMITEASRKANKLFVMHSAKQISKEKQIKDGYTFVEDQNGNVVADSLGNSIKVDKFKTVRCDFYQFTQFKSAQVTGVVSFIDLKKQQKINNF